MKNAIFKSSKRSFLTSRLNFFSKQFSKKISRTNSAFKKFDRLCHTFPENDFNFATQKLVEKSEKCYFLIIRTFVFHLMVSSKALSEMFPMTNIKPKPFYEKERAYFTKLFYLRVVYIEVIFYI